MGGSLAAYVYVCLCMPACVCVGNVSHLSVSGAPAGEGRVESLSWRDKAGRKRAAARQTEAEDD